MQLLPSWYVRSTSGYKLVSVADMDSWVYFSTLLFFQHGLILTSVFGYGATGYSVYCGRLMKLGSNSGLVSRLLCDHRQDS